MQVLIVTGGDTGYPDYLDLSSTETWTRGSSQWTPAADLPSPRHSLRGVSFGGHFIVTGEHIAILTHSIKAHHAWRNLNLKYEASEEDHH